MSGVAVVFHRDGAPVEAGELEAMTAAMAERAVDGVHHEVTGPIGVGFCSMATTPEAAREVQPLRRGPLLLALDGRIDGQRSLRAALGRIAPPDHGDAGLLCSAVERWGERFVDHVIGDFAVVVADVERRRVVCARDHLGVRPLYYAVQGQLFVAASEVKAVLAHPGVPTDLDPEAFAAYADHWIVPEGTMYRAVARLPMGSTLTVAATSPGRPRRYWEPSCTPDATLTPQALIEEYRDLVQEATRDRLRSRGPIVVAMSGGLDSTSVAATAVALAGSEPGHPDVHLASAVFPGHPLVDESAQIDAMEQWLGVPVRRVRPAGRGPVELAAEIASSRDLPGVPNDPFPSLVRPEEGERVLLSGLGGDDWFANPNMLELTIAVRHGRLLAAARAARQARAGGGSPSAVRAFGRFGVRPLLRLPGTVAGRSPTLSRAVTRLGGRLGTRALSVPLGWAARALRAGWCPPGVPLDTAPVLAWSRDARLGSQFASVERRASHLGYEPRHPLHDVRLVELSLRLPGALRTRGGDGRWLPREAMADRLPEAVRRRREKAEFSLMVREELELASAAGVLEAATRTADDPTGARADWCDVRASPADVWHPRLTSLWSILAIHLTRVSQVEGSVLPPPGPW